MKHVHASHPGNPQKFDMDQRQDTIAEPMQELRLKTGINRFGKRKMTEHISFKNSRSILELLWPIVLSLAVGAFSAYMQSDSIQYWYPLLNKPPLTPPRIVFPIVWTVLYIMTGLSMGLVLQRKNQRKRLLLMLFLFQLFLTFFWCYLFFVCQNPLNGLICIVVLLWSVIWYAIQAWPVSRTASFLFWPYSVWLCFATYLNLYIHMYN